MNQPRKDLLNIRTLSIEEIRGILDTAKPFKELFTRSVKKVPTLRGKSVLTLFYEPSTRTKTSFEVAAKRLSADVTNFEVAQSSVVKGETVLDTVNTLRSMKTDYVIVRHPSPGVPNLIAEHSNASVINAGDGVHSHPTQALLDAFTIENSIGDIKGKKVLIAGDILHSRVARSTSTLLEKLGAKVGVFGPRSLISRYRRESLQSFDSWEKIWKWQPDVIYLLRVQEERQGAQFFPSKSEYHKNYGLTVDRLNQMKDKGIWLMHPGPVNRDVELTDEALQYDKSLINEQVENGIAVRMAVLYTLCPINDDPDNS